MWASCRARATSVGGGDLRARRGQGIGELEGERSIEGGDDDAEVGRAADGDSVGQRRGAAQPLPLEGDAGPDALGDGGGEARGRLLGAREGERAPHADLHVARADAPAGAHVLGPEHGDGYEGHARLQRQAPDAALRRAERAGADARALGEHEDGAAAGEDRLRRLDRAHVGVAPGDGEGAQRVEDPGREAVREELLLGHVVDGLLRDRGDHEGIEEGAVVGREDDGAVGYVLEPDPLHAEVQAEEGLEERAEEPVDDGVDPVLPGPALK